MTHHVPDYARQPLATGTLVQQALASWLMANLSTEDMDWLLSRVSMLQRGQNSLDFLLAFSAVSRHIPKQFISFTEADARHADALVSGWQPWSDTLDQLARAYLLTYWPSLHQDTYQVAMRNLVSTAGGTELMAIAKALPLLPHAQAVLVPIATDLLRHNVLDVFKALALHNPFPSIHMPDAAFNQMVLKAAFNALDLNDIVGIRDRVNPQLVQMLTDYIAEREAAGRTVNPLWRELAGS